jgi:hypothetical protein
VIVKRIRIYRLPAFLALGLFVALAGGQQTSVVGRLTAARNTKISRGPATLNSQYDDAKVGSAVREGQGVRTFRRSFAEITFSDGSAIRVNEQTDLIVQSAATLRLIRLEQGALWVRDEHGSRTSVQTPVGTATARGTEFIVSGDGTVTVKEGSVDLEAKGVVLTIEAGQTGGIGPGGTPEKLGNGVPDGGDNWYDKGQAMPVPTLALGGLAGVLGSNVGAGGNRVRGGGNPVPEPMSIVALGGAAAFLIRRKSRRI